MLKKIQRCIYDPFNNDISECIVLIDNLIKQLDQKKIETKGQNLMYFLNSETPLKA